MTVKIPIKTRFEIGIRVAMKKVGWVVCDFGKWLARGCKPEPEIYKRGNGVIHTLPCAGDLYILEGGVALIACESNLASLPEMVRIVGEDVTNLANAIENLPQEVE